MRTFTLIFVLVVSACSNTSDGPESGPAADTSVSDTSDPDTSASDTQEPPADSEPADTAPPEDSSVEPPPDTTEPADTQEPPDTNEGLPPANGVPQFSLCTEPGGDRNIYDLQNPACPDHIDPAPTEQPGIPVILEGVVVTAVFGDTLFVQEVPGGPYSGITIFSHGLPTQDLVPGDEVRIEGNYMEYFGNSQVYLEDWSVTGQVEALQPFVPSHPAHVATGGEMAEMFEGVLLRVETVTTIHTKPDCPQDWGEFLVTGDLRIDDAGYKWEAHLGDEFSAITGPLYFGFSNFKIQPRTEEDVVATKVGAASSVSKCIESDCIVPTTVEGTKEVIVNEIMADPFGGDAGQEWIELYNPGSEEISLDGWELRDCGGQVVPLIGANLVIPAKGYFVLGMNANEITNGGVPVDHAYGDAFYLPNTVGSVLLFNGTDAFAEVVDQTRYSAFEPWDVFKTGSSLERVGPNTDGTVPQSWNTGEGSYGVGENQGSPGVANN